MADTDKKDKFVLFPFKANEAIWKKIVDELSTPVTNIDELESLLLKTSELRKELGGSSHTFSDEKKKQRRVTGQNALRSALEYNKAHHSETYDRFFDALPKVQKLAIKLPELFSDDVLLLLSGDNKNVVTLTQEACASLVANVFFGTLVDPPRYMPENSQLYLSFFSWFESLYAIPYIEALLNYLTRVGSDVPQGKVSFRRSVVKDLEDLNTSTKPLTKATIHAKGTLEDSKASLQANFANEYIGGGVLRGARAQEEILFCFRPELFCAIALFSRMKPYEAIIVKGAERFGTFTGYRDSLKFAGDYVDETPRDEEGFRKIEIICFDAVVAFHINQFTETSIQRDILKAYAAFSPSHSAIQGLPGDIATGNWGCGAFGGHKELKFVEQFISASLAGRNLLYFTFNERDITEGAEKFLAQLQEIQSDKPVTVSQLYQALLSVAKTCHADTRRAIFPEILEELKKKK